MLFWAIELFVFGTYIYLVLNCAVETEWLLHQPQLFQKTKSLSTSFVYATLVLLSLCVFLQLSIRLNTTRYNNTTPILMGGVVLASIMMLFEETTQLIFFFTAYNHTTLGYDDELFA